MIDIYDFVKIILNNKSDIFRNVKYEILNKELICDYFLKNNDKYDIDYYIYKKYDIKFNYNCLNYYNINNIIYLYTISKIKSNIQTLIITFYNNLVMFKKKIYNLCHKHNENKYYNTIDNITSHIIYNISIKHITIYNKYNYFKKGIYYKIKNKICYYYDILNNIILNNNKLLINKLIKLINSFIEKDLYYIDKYENNNILKILIK